MTGKIRRLSRRKFIVLLAPALFLNLAYSNCGKFELISTGSSETVEQGSTIPTSPAKLPSFTLKSPVANESAPFVIGHAFKKGDVPAGTEVRTVGADAQVTAKNRWPDGSLKFAIIAGTAKLETNSATSIQLSSGPALSGSALTTLSLKGAGVTASIAAEGIGSVTWENADWENPFQNWISGPRMSSFVYRKSIPGDNHLTAWLEVRIFSSGAVEVLPWIENGYLNVQTPTNKNTKYTFSLSGTQKFALTVDLPHHTRSPLIDGPELSYWLNIQDPQVTPRHDVQYLQSTELVPTYNVVLDPTQVTNVPPKFSPLQQGNFNYSSDSMASSGYQSPIGLLPVHDMLYLTCPDPCPAYQSVIRNGYSAGRYPIHYRDETTQRPLRFSAYPNLVINDGCGFKDNGASSGGMTPTCSGTGPRSWDTAHSPSVGYMAYLLTGRWYFMEETQFAATTNFLGLTNTSVMRNFSEGILHPVTGAFQTRSSAWAIRTLIQALTATPDDDVTLRNEFKNSWEANISFHYRRYIAQPHNPFGFILPGESYGAAGLGATAPWQQDFVTSVWGYAVSLDLPVSAEKAKQTSEFFQWKARSIVGRLGTANEFWYVNGAPYTMTFSPSASPDWVGGKGPWLSSWKEIYAATYATPYSWMSSTEGTLGAEYTIDSWAKSMWGNIQPAIAYAVRHDVPGAKAAYDRMTSANNWKQLASYFPLTPGWSVAPALKEKGPE